VPDIDEEVTSWAELADDLEYAFPGIAARIRRLIPRLGDLHGPPGVGQIIAGDRLDRCLVGTVLRGDSYGAAAIRTVNGWTVTGMNAAQSAHFVKINFWKVVEVPESGRKTS
jgi:hypothetical protein